MELERALFSIYDNCLAAFADELVFLRAQGQSRITGKLYRSCGAIALVTGSLTALMFAGFLTLHNNHAYKPGCVSQSISAAVSVWAGNSASSGVPSNSTVATFLGPLDVVSIRVDWSRQGCSFAAGSPAGALPCVLITDGPVDSNLTTTSPLYALPLGSVLNTNNGVPGAGFAPHYVYSRSPAMVSLATEEAFGTGPSLPGSGYAGLYRRISVIVPPTCGHSVVSGTTAYELAVLGLGSYDSIIVNDLQWGQPDGPGGFLRSMTTGEEWGWPTPRSLALGLGFAGPSSPLPEQGGRNAYAYTGEAFASRLDATFRLIILGFIGLTTANALLVRVLFTSGVAVMYALVVLVRCCGGVDRVPAILRTLNAAYPWLGVYVTGLQESGAPLFPFLASNVLYSLLCFMLYDCAATVLSPLMFGYKSFPSSIGPMLWTTFGLVEAFTFLFLRSARGIALFPRSVLLLYCFWAWYYASVPYGFATEAAAALSLAYLHVACLTLWLCEVHALSMGKVTDNRPRELMVQLGAREPVHPIVGLPYTSPVPPLWSILHPLQVFEAPAQVGLETPPPPSGPPVRRPANPVARHVASGHGGDVSDGTSVSLSLQSTLGRTSESDRGQPLLGSEETGAEGQGPSRRRD